MAWVLRAFDDGLNGLRCDVDLREVQLMNNIVGSCSCLDGFCRSQRHAQFLRCACEYVSVQAPFMADGVERWCVSLADFMLLEF